jgi:tyrosyl-tRNA synthetase
MSEFDYWQFWRNTADVDVIRYNYVNGMCVSSICVKRSWCVALWVHVVRFMKLFTDVSMEEIRGFEALEGLQLNAVKVRLADEATQLLHGPACLAAIHATVANLYGAGGATVAGVSAQATGGASSLDSLKQVVIQKCDFSGDEDSSIIAVVDLLVKGGLASSKNEARRLITAGGARVNDEKVVEEIATVNKHKDFDSKFRLKLSAGKKKHVLIVISDE